MATAVVETFLGISGLTLTCDLYPLGSDTAAASGLTFTEATNRLGLYTTTTTAALNGVHQAFIKSGGTVLGLGYIFMTDDTSVHRILDTMESVDTSGAYQSFTVITGSSTSIVKTNRTEADGFWQSTAMLAFNTGALKGVAHRIASYLNANGAFTLNNTLPAIPAVGDTGYIIGGSN